MSDVVIEVWTDQTSVKVTLAERDGPGFRLAGTKFHGYERLLVQSQLDQQGAQELRRFADKIDAEAAA